jgi:hypothetical protein
MSNLTRILPFSELVEKAQTLARDNTSGSRDKFKGLINRAYTQVIPRKEDWSPLITSSTITCYAQYNTGTVAITAGATAIVGTGTTWTAAMSNRKIKINGNDNVYTFTRTAATTGTISPALSGANNISGAGYTIYDDDYSLTSDFDRFLSGGSLYRYRSGRPFVIPEVSERLWRDEFVNGTSDEVMRCRMRGFDSSMNRVVEVNPAPNTAISLQYDYVKFLPPMTEYNTGTISTLANGAAAVTGVSTDFDGYGSTSYTYYLRIDRDGIGDSSVWYKISSFDSNTGITLASNYNGASIASGTEPYTISMIPLLPYNFHDWMIYSAAIESAVDSEDPAVQGWMAIASQIESECKKLWKNRNPNKDIEVEI